MAEDQGFINFTFKNIADKNITIADFFTYADEYAEKTHTGKDKYNKKAPAILKAFESVEGLDPYATNYHNYLTIENAKNLMLSEKSTATTFKNITTLENVVQNAYTAQGGTSFGSYPFTFIEGKRMGGAGVKANQLGLSHLVPASELGNPETSSAYADRKLKNGNVVKIRISEQTRGTKAIIGDLPTASTLGQIMKKYVSNIDDVDVREAVLFNLLIPYRPGEVAGLTYDDINFDTGVIREYSRPNKLRQEIKLSKVALELLKKRRDLVVSEIKNQKINDPDIEKEAIDRALSGKSVFDKEENPTKFVAKMTKTTTNKGANSLVSLFKPYEKDLKNQELRGSKYIRKLSASILASTLEAAKLPTGVVTKLLGHVDRDASVGEIVETMNKMTSTSYVVARLKTEGGVRSTMQTALDILEGVVGSSAGALNVNTIAPVFNVEIPTLDLDTEGATVIPFPELGESQTPDAEPPRPPTKFEREYSEQIVKQNIASSRLEVAETDLKTVETQRKTVEAQKGLAETQVEIARKDAEAASEVEQLKIDAEQKRKEVRDANKPPPAKTVAEKYGIDVSKDEDMFTFFKNLDTKKALTGLAVGTASLLAKPPVVKATELAVDTAEFALAPSPAGETPLKDASEEELMRMMQEGVPQAGQSSTYIDSTSPQDREEAVQDEAMSRYEEQQESFAKMRDTKRREARQQGLSDQDKFVPKRSGFLDEYEAYFEL